jgi:hypothetical protein
MDFDHILAQVTEPLDMLEHFDEKVILYLPDSGLAQAV